jgi:hypothetical protein
MLLTRLLLFTRLDEPRVSDVAAIPPGKGPISNDLGVHDDLDEHIEERDDLKILKLVVANLA